MKERYPKGLPVGPILGTQGPEITLIEPSMSWVRAPPLEEPVHWEKTIIPTVPLEIVAESRPAYTIPTATVGGGDPARPSTLKNLEAPGKCSGIKHPAVTPWLTEMLYWIRLSKVPKDDLWDVVATRMARGALTWINARMSVAEDLGVRPWVSWKAFATALKAQFEPLSKEECARE